MTRPRTSILSLLLLILAGCASSDPDPAATRYLVAKADTPFYIMGPGQARAPDEFLDENTAVEMLDRSYGYSLVKLESGRSGYVGTTFLTPATIAEENPQSAAAVAPSNDRSAVVGHFTANDEVEETALPVASPELPKGEIDTPLTDFTGTPEELPAFRF